MLFLLEGNYSTALISYLSAQHNKEIQLMSPLPYPLNTIFLSEQDKRLCDVEKGSAVAWITKLDSSINTCIN